MLEGPHGNDIEGGTDMKRFGLALIALGAVLSPEQILAQSALPATETRIRVRTVDVGAPGSTQTHDWVEGRLHRVGADSLWLRAGSLDGPLLSIDRATIRELEIAGGRERNPGKGALLGTGVGLVMGLLAVATLDDCGVATRGWSFDLCSGNEDVLILGSMAAGSAWGAVVGLLITSERWVTVPQASLIHGESGMGTRLVLGFRMPR
jgi:hypothetical protein